MGFDDLLDRGKAEPMIGGAPLPGKEMSVCLLSGAAAGVFNL